MANFNRGVVFWGDIRTSFKVTEESQLAATLESFSYDYSKTLNQAGQVYGAHEPAMLEFSVRLRNTTHARTIINDGSFKDARKEISFLFDPTIGKNRNNANTILGYKDGLYAEGYVVHTELEFHSAKDKQGLERQTILHVKFLLTLLVRFDNSHVNGSQTTAFIVKKETDDTRKDLVEGDSRLRLSIAGNDNDTNQWISAAGSKSQPVTIDEIQYFVTLHSLSVIKAIYRHHEVKVRLYFHPRSDEERKFISKTRLESSFLGKRVKLMANETYTIFDGYFVEEVMPSYFGRGELYVDLTIYSPDYLLETDYHCRSFVGKKLSSIVKEMTNSCQLPYDKAKTLAYGDVTANLRHLVQNQQEHIFPYLVQYNESNYDFLRRTFNRWGEFMYYDNGQLNFGYASDVSNVTSVKVANLDSEGANNVVYCQSMTYQDPETEKSPVIEVNDFSMEAAQDFMDDVLTKGEYEKPAWASDNLTGDLVAYGKAIRHTDEQKSKFNKDYFDDPKDGIPKDYDEQYAKQDDDIAYYNEFTEKDPSAFRALDRVFYKTILAKELGRSRNTVVFNFDTRCPELSLGQVVKFGDVYYIVTEFSLQLERICPVYQVKVVRAPEIREENNIQHAVCYPPYLASGHIRKTGLMKATVADADDPLRRNRVRLRFDWQAADSDPTPWLMVAQDGATREVGSHVRHYKDERVLVDFIGGNVERPYVIGSVSEELPSKNNWDNPLGIFFRTPNGQSLRMTDGVGKGKPNTGNVEIRDQYNIYNIKGSTTDHRVSISSSWGQADFDAFTGICLSAPYGDVKISGKNVTIEAANNLKLVSGTNIRKKYLTEDPSLARLGDKCMGVAGIKAPAPETHVGAKDAAAKALLSFDEKGGIDFTLLRHIRDMFVKPVEGVLEMQSNRFLKLEANGASTGYPVKDYKEHKIEDPTDVTEEQWYKRGAEVADMIGASWRYINNWFRNYGDCLEKTVERISKFDGWVILLRKYSEIEQTEEPKDLQNGSKVCNRYDDLKDKIAGTEELKEDDMGFVDELVGIDDKSSTVNANKRIGKSHESVLLFRKSTREAVLTRAKEIQEGYQALKKKQFSTDDIDSRNAFFWGYNDKKLDIVKQALSADKCSSKSALYQTISDLSNVDPTDDTYKNLADVKNPETAEKIAALKHLVALNILEGLGFKAKKNGQTVEIGSLVESDDDLLKNWNKTAGYIVYEYAATDNKEEFIRSKKVRERDVWSNAKSGQILVSSGETYALGRDIQSVPKTTEDLTKTAELMDKLAETIEKAMEVGTFSSLSFSVGVKAAESEKEAKLSAADKDPKIKEDFKQVEKKENEENKEEGNQDAQENQENQDAQEDQDAQENQDQEDKKEEKQEEVAEEENKEEVVEEENKEEVAEEEKKEEAVEEEQQQEGKKEEEKKEEAAEENKEKEQEDKKEEQQVQEENQAEVVVVNVQEQGQEQGQEQAQDEQAQDEQPQEQQEDQEEEMTDAYYQCGDIVKYKGRCYVCVSKHNKDEEARFVTLNDQDDHSKNIKKFSYKVLKGDVNPDYDTVYNDDMASAETLVNWVSNILFDQDMCQKLRNRMVSKDISKNTNQIVPSKEGLREELINMMKNPENLTLNCAVPITNELAPYKIPAEALVWDCLRYTDRWDEEFLDEDQELRLYPDNAEVNVCAPIGFLLSDKLIYKTNYDEGHTGHWVPYIFLAKDRKWNKYEEVLNEVNSMQNTDNFQWEELGTVTYKNETYRIMKVAMYWSHRPFVLVNDGAEQFMLVDFTKDLANHPQAIKREQGQDVPDSWGNKIITSKEYTFTDNGSQNSKLTNVWVKREDEEPGQQDQQEETCHYKVGDIIMHKGRLYVCVSKHKLNGTATFVTLNDQKDHQTTTISWKKVGEDKVYSDEMASGETLRNWVGNILFMSDNVNAVRQHLSDRGISEAKWNQVVPQNDAQRFWVADSMSDLDRLMVDISEADGEKYSRINHGATQICSMSELVHEYEDQDMEIGSDEWDKVKKKERNIRLVKGRPCGYMLVDKVIKKESTFGVSEYWVPFIFLFEAGIYLNGQQDIRDKETREYRYQYCHIPTSLNKREKILNCSSFKWENHGAVMLRNDIPGVGNRKPKYLSGYEVVELALHWKHDKTEIENIYQRVLMDFTSSWYDASSNNADYNDADRKYWVNQCITSRELKFTDDGQKNNDYKSVWVDSEGGGDDLQDDDIASMD